MFAKFVAAQSFAVYELFSPFVREFGMSHARRLNLDVTSIFHFDRWCTYYSLVISTVVESIIILVAD